MDLKLSGDGTLKSTWILDTLEWDSQQYIFILVTGF